MHDRATESADKATAAREAAEDVRQESNLHAEHAKILELSPAEAREKIASKEADATDRTAATDEAQRSAAAASDAAERQKDAAAKAWRGRLNPALEAAFNDASQKADEASTRLGAATRAHELAEREQSFWEDAHAKAQSRKRPQ